MAVRSLADPNPPDRHLQTCPTLGPTSFGICAYEAAVRGHRGLAEERPRQRPFWCRQIRLSFADMAPASHGLRATVGAAL